LKGDLKFMSNVAERQILSDAVQLAFSELFTLLL